MKSDTTWANLLAAAQALTEQYCEGDTVRVSAYRSTSVLLTVSEGLVVCDRWTDFRLPIRERRVWIHNWNAVQTLEQAVEQVDAFFRDRPDLAGFDRDS